MILDTPESLFYDRPAEEPMPLLRSQIASFRLAITLLLAIPLFGAIGTAVPQGLDPSQYAVLYPSASRLILALGLDHYYQSPLYRGLLALFAANLLGCTAGRAADGLWGVLGEGRPSRFLDLGSREAWAARLATLGFRIRSEAPLRATKRAWGFLGFPLVHAAPLAILAGGLWGSFAGFVGTKNVYVGGSTTTAYDWSARSDRTLPFTLLVEDFRLFYYPTEIEVRVETAGVSDVVRTRVGAPVRVSGTAYGLRVEGFDAETRDVVYRLDTPAGRVGPFSRKNSEAAPVRVELLAYRDPQVRRAEADVALLGSDGSVLARDVVAINRPLSFEGLRIFLTAWDRDPSGFPYTGFQIVRDPGQPLTWAGAAALCLGLFLLLCVDAAWVR